MSVFWRFLKVPKDEDEDEDEKRRLCDIVIC